MHDEWTSCFDIGKSFKGVTLSVAEYLRVEDAYVHAVLNLAESEEDFFTITALEKNYIPHPLLVFTREMEAIYKQIHIKSRICAADLPYIIRLALQEKIWCKLEHKNMYIHFGYDYYMYVGCTKPCTTQIAQIKKEGLLYVEQYHSPYSQ